MHFRLRNNDRLNKKATDEVAFLSFFYVNFFDSGFLNKYASYLYQANNW